MSELKALFWIGTVMVVISSVVLTFRYDDGAWLMALVGVIGGGFIGVGSEWLTRE